MAVTRLERKGRKNKNVAKKRVATIQRLSFVPVIKNVDIDAIKKEFHTRKLKATAKADKVEKKVTVKAEKASVKVEKVSVKAEKIGKTMTSKAKNSKK